jgi:hypothetical protein
MAGRFVPSDDVAGDCAAGAGAGAAPGDEGCSAEVPAAGASPAGPDCSGACAQALTQTDEIRKDVDASKRGRIDINAPCPEGEELQERP